MKLYELQVARTITFGGNMPVIQEVPVKKETNKMFIVGSNSRYIERLPKSQIGVLIANSFRYSIIFREGDQEKAIALATKQIAEDLDIVNKQRDFLQQVFEELSTGDVNNG